MNIVPTNKEKGDKPSSDKKDPVLSRFSRTWAYCDSLFRETRLGSLSSGAKGFLRAQEIFGFVDGFILTG